MTPVRLALEAMATRFEVVMYGECPVSLRAAGEEALEEITHLEGLLSYYRPTSEVSQINRRAALHPVRVPARVFEVLQHASHLYSATGGAFDITVAPLMKCWGFVRGSGQWPAQADIDRARAITGMHHVTLDEHDRTVAFDTAGVALDLGGIGKGYAVDEAVRILKECGVECALLHGGTSTMAAWGTPPKEAAWRIALPAGPDPQDIPLGVVDLHNEALSVSAVWGKAFEHRGKVFGHVIDPRTGTPAHSAQLSAVAHASAMTADALSTALLVLTAEERARTIQKFGKLRHLVVQDSQQVSAVGMGAHPGHPRAHHQ